MILISRKVDYGVLALCHLMAAEHGVSARELADHYGLPKAFVANILKQLCSAGFISSQRGVHGGYHLACEPKNITLAQLIDTLDGPFQLMSCASGQDAGCELSSVCPVKSPLRIVHEKLRATLAEVTLEDLKAEPELALVALDMENSNGCAAHLHG